MVHYVLCFFLLLSLISCGSHTLQDFREEGERITQEIIDELQQIYSREDLISSEASLELLFNKLASVMIRARECKDKYPSEETLSFSEKNRQQSERLRNELNRIYLFDGAREIIERCQEDGLNRLDACEKRSQKSSEQRAKGFSKNSG